MASNDSTIPISSGEIIPLNQLSFRKPILFYVKNNSNPRLSLKLMQSSRYFCFKEFPYQVVEDLRYVFGVGIYYRLGQNGPRRIDFGNLSKPFWITKILVFFDYETPLSQLLLKTAVCDVKKLDLRKQIIKMVELQFLVSSKAVENFYLCETQIIYDDGSFVPIHKIVKLLPNVKSFRWFCHTPVLPHFTPTSTKKLVKYFDPSVLIRFDVDRLSETFDFELFAEFMDQNPLIHFHLAFGYTLSDEYAKTVQAYIDKLIISSEYKNRKIMITFFQENTKHCEILSHHNYHN